MSRTTIILLVALGAGLAGFAFSSASEGLRDRDDDAQASTAARPQHAELDWRETYGKPGARLVFRVESLEVSRNGWEARLSVENDTRVAFEVGDPRATLDRSFGLMLFSSGEITELEQRNANGTLPEPRIASRYDPELPAVLEPGDTWEGTMSAAGALVANAWVRVVFGTLIAVGNAPEELGEQIVWITDHAYRLRE